MKLSGQSQAVLMQAGLVVAAAIAVVWVVRRAATDAGAAVSDAVSDMVDTVLGAPGAAWDATAGAVKDRVEEMRQAEEPVEDWQEWNPN